MATPSVSPIDCCLTSTEISSTSSALRSSGRMRSTCAALSLPPAAPFLHSAERSGLADRSAPFSCSPLSERSVSPSATIISGPTKPTILHPVVSITTNCSGCRSTRSSPWRLSWGPAASWTFTRTVKVGALGSLRNDLSCHRAAVATPFSSLSKTSRDASENCCLFSLFCFLFFTQYLVLSDTLFFLILAFFSTAHLVLFVFVSRWPFTRPFHSP